jgi:hypothetical protein
MKVCIQTATNVCDQLAGLNLRGSDLDQTLHLEPTHLEYSSNQRLHALLISRRLVVGGWWLVVGGWWLGSKRSKRQ